MVPEGDGDETLDSDAHSLRVDPDLSLDIDDLAAALQLDARRSDALELADEDDIEELEELDDLADEHTSPRSLFLEVDGRHYTVAQDRFVIGRAQCDLAIIDANISRQHCVIERRDGRFVVKDLGSTNGIEIAGKRVPEHVIEDGDVFVLSGHRVRCSFEPFEREAPVPDEPPPRAASTIAVTGRLAPVPTEAAPVVEPTPIEPATPAEPTTFEERVEQRLADIAEEVAQLRMAVQHLVGRFAGLEGIDALAQVIQRRLQAAKRDP